MPVVRCLARCQECQEVKLGIFDKVQEMLTDRFGLFPREGWQASLERVISDIGDAANLPGESLLDSAMTDAVLLRDIAGRMTVPESFFFRYPDQLDDIVEFIKHRLSCINPGMAVRIWSAGCSHGEEPYSLAVLFRENLPGEELHRISILASDINGKAIETARKGIYSPWSFRGMSYVRKRAYFKALDERKYLLHSDIRSMVEFYHGSIQEQFVTIERESLDVVLFRNVAIYLASESLPPLYKGISGSLRTGGWLCLSHSDPPVTHPDLERLETFTSPIYRKRPTQLRSELSLAQVHPVFHAASPHSTVSEGLSSSRADEKRRPERQMDRLNEGLAKADQGQFDAAAKIADELVTRFPDSSQGYYLRGQLSLAMEQRHQAEDDFRKAIQVNPLDLQARFWYALTLFEGESPKRSRIHLTSLDTELSGLHEHLKFSDGKTTVGELLRMVRAILQKMEQ